jgi:2-haloacid dehalogenase
MTIKQIVFDFGGVLVDWNPRYMYQKYFEDEEAMEHFLNNVCTNAWNEQQDGGRPLQVATDLLIEQFPEHEVQIRRYYDQWTEMVGGAIEENVAVLYALEKKYPLYGLTNWSGETFPWAYDNFDFFKKLKGIVVSGDEQMKKPNPAIYQVLLDRYQLSPQESLFIDDNAANITAADSLGFETIHLADGISLSDEIRSRGLL